MPHNSFSAMELAAMAAAAGAEKVYGLPDVFAGTSQGEQTALLQSATESLMKKHVLQMDFDGITELEPEYKELFAAILSCEKCLTVNLQDAQNGARAFIFWKTENNTVTMAEAVEDRYILSSSDGDFLKALVASFAFVEAGHAEIDLTIPAPRW